MSANLTLKVDEDLDGDMFGTQAVTGVASNPPALGNVSHNEGLDVSLSHNSNTDYLLVGIMQGLHDSAAIPTGVTYAGAAMTKIGEIAYDGVQSGSKAVSVWEKKNPASGANTVAVTFTSGSGYYVIGAVSISGVNLTTPTGTVATNSGTNATATVNASSASNELVVDFTSIGPAVTATDVSAIAAGAGQTEQVDFATGDGSVHCRGGVSTEAGATTTTMSWAITTGGLSNWKIIAVPVKPL